MEVGPEGVTNILTGVSLSLNPAEIEVGQVIGQGNSGVVFAARHIPTNTLIALKSINVYERERRKQLENDLKALDEMNCPYLVSYYGAFVIEGSVKVAMELMDYGSVRRIVNATKGRPEPAVPEEIVHRLTVPVIYIQILVSSGGKKAFEVGFITSSIAHLITPPIPYIIENHLFPYANLNDMGFLNT